MSSDGETEEIRSDVLITHGLPFGIRDRNMQLAAISRSRPRLHVFGLMRVRQACIEQVLWHVALGAFAP